MAHDSETYRHWRMDQDSDGFIWLTFDYAGRKVNTLSREAMEELSRILETISRQSPAGLAIRSGKASGFVAGADITEFTGLSDNEQALALIGHGQEILGRLERLPFPTVSIVNGFCLGGGLELALACRYRIALDTPETRLGLPEVRLGIHPGFGGTVRLPQLIGPLAALEMMLTGRSVGPREARRLGLVDIVVDRRHLDDAARSLLLFTPSPARPGLLAAFCSVWFLRPLLAAIFRHKAAGHTDRRYYPAPYAIIDLWEKHAGNPAAMYLAEARSIAGLITGDTSRNLVRLFLLKERLSSFGRHGSPSPKSVHLVGGGTMGGDIAAWCALQGMRVTIQDVDQARLAKVVKRAAVLFRKVLREPRLVQAALDRLIPDIDGYGLNRADMVIEAIFENIDAKRELFRHIEQRMRPDAILATNTSSIPLEELSGSLTSPERLVGLHFFNPVAKMQLVEVVRGKDTSEETVARACAFVVAIRRLPLPVASSPGFLVNRVLVPYLMEAIIMESEGIPKEEIDGAATDFGMPMGPILLADTVGLDICLSVARNLAGHCHLQTPERLEELVKGGRLGKKSGSGFYSYKAGKAVISRRNRVAGPGGEVQERLILQLLNAAVACRREKVAADADLIDAGVVFGTGFAPFRGGPLRHIRHEGIAFFHGRLNTFEERFGSRFTADEGWSELPPEGQDAS
jgi:3-hydroxyacyl-CoA dehydrogenase/enoyl-CoA hydratase/3-hydroxybutyryl-CoA epimerase